MNLAIGIDLGTSYSSVGVFRNDRFEIIPNEEGRFTTPSVVAFTEKGRLIGDRANRQLALNPYSTVFDVQRLVGRGIAGDLRTVIDMGHFPLKVRNTQYPWLIEVRHKAETKLLMPVEVIAIILGKMKELAEKCLGFSVRNAVITCPTSWNMSQRQTIKDAASIAGLYYLRIIDSPTCAAVAHSIDNRDMQDDRNVLIFDVGGGTTNVTLLNVDEGAMVVMAVAGDDHLGGEDFVNRLIYHSMKEFKLRYQKDIPKKSRSICRLRSACEQAKCMLSSSTTTDIDIEDLFEGIDFKATITRAKFEEICDDLFRSLLHSIDRVLADAKLDRSQVHEVVLIGGSTRIPKIQKLLTDYFNGREPTKSTDCDLAPCHGAAIQAAVLCGDTSSKSIHQTLLLDVQPISLGVETTGGTMHPIIPRNTSIPSKKSTLFASTPSAHSQAPVLAYPISIYEGEYVHATKNTLIATSDVDPPIPHSSAAHLEVTFDMDSNSSLTIRVRDINTGQDLLSLRPGAKALSQPELKQLQAQAERYREDDAAEAARVAARDAFESRIYSLQNAIGELRVARCVGPAEIERLEATVDASLDWLDHDELATTEEYENLERELSDVQGRAGTMLSKAIESAFENKMS